MSDPKEHGSDLPKAQTDWFDGDPRIARETEEKIRQLQPKLKENPALYNQPKIKAFLDQTIHINPFAPKEFAGLSLDELFTPYKTRPNFEAAGDFLEIVGKGEMGVIRERRTVDSERYRSFLLENEEFFRPQAKSAIHSPKYYFQKTLEYFTTYSEFCDGGYGSIMDVGTAGGAYTRVLLKNLGSDRAIYTQDIALPEGVRRKDGYFEVGGSAAAMPLPDDSVDFMAIHCAYEHFEGNADSGFIEEAARVLSPGGKVVILPFYRADKLLFRVNPVAGSFGDGFFERIEKDATEAGATVEFHTQTNSRFARFYDVAGFEKRILEPAREKFSVSLVTYQASDELGEMTFFDADYFEGAFSKFPTDVFFHHPVLILEKNSPQKQPTGNREGSKKRAPVDPKTSEHAAVTAPYTSNEIQLLGESIIDEHPELAMDVLGYASKLGIGLGWHYVLDLAWVLSLLELKKGSVILDAGGGNGLLQFMLASRGFKVISADIRERKVPGFAKNMYNVPFMSTGDELVHDYLGWHGLRGIQKPGASLELDEDLPTVIYYHCNLNDLSLLEDDSVDAVVSISVIEHNPPEDIAPILSELERVRKKGAPMILTISGANRSYFHEASYSWILDRADIQKVYGLGDPVITNYDSYDEHWRAIKEPRYLQKWLGKYYFNSDKSGMPRGEWKPQYLPVGVLKI